MATRGGKSKDFGAKKRKVTESPQSKLPNFFGENNETMTKPLVPVVTTKLDSPYNQFVVENPALTQVTVNRFNISFVNSDEPRPHVLPDNYFTTCWNEQRMVINCILTKTSPPVSYISVSRLCENLCRFGQSQALYSAIRGELESFLNILKDDLTQTQNKRFIILKKLSSFWITFCGQLTILKNIFIELDRTYIVMHTPDSSLIDLGKSLFGSIVFSSPTFKHQVIQDVIQLIELYRTSGDVDTQLIRTILHILMELSYYTQDFEPSFLQTTADHYRRSAATWIQSKSPSDYIVYAYEKRKHETEDCVRMYLNPKTKAPLLHVISKELFYDQVEVLLSLGFDTMMRAKETEPLKKLFDVLVHSPKLVLLRHYFGDYVKVSYEGEKLIKDPSNDATMISSLLDFRHKIDSILKECFNNDSHFFNALKESFEYFINTRNNRPTELLAKFMDSRLKSTPRRGRRSEIDMEEMDQALSLFRYIQGKDSFEVYYKRLLAKRLIMDRSISMDAEKRVVEKLRAECGHEYTKDLELMFSDIEVSKELNVSFRALGKCKMPMTVKVITQSTWPTYTIYSMKLPPAMVECQRMYEEFYTSKYNGRKLTWQNYLSSCVVVGTWTSGEKEMVISVPQTVTLLQFNDTSVLNYTIDQLKTRTGLDTNELNGVLESLSTLPNKLLRKWTDGGDIRYGFNERFRTRDAKLRIQAVQSDQKVEEKDVESKVLINRTQQLEAAIVRIMKSEKTLTHTALVDCVFKEIKLPLEALDVKRIIEGLIDKDYLARDLDNPSLYIYQNCDEYEVWPFIADDLSSRLPLRNLRWQPSTQRPACNIPTLEVDLKRYTADPTPPALSATQTVYLNLYFVSCDDNEVYKNKVRKNIRTWLDMIQTKKNQEWMIVYVADAEAKRTNNYLGLKSSVYDKIRTDFNPPKLDRCAYIRKQDPEGAQSSLWTTFIEKIKECILSSFDMQVLQIQDDTRRLDMQRHMPGWNYCTFFILKEGLAQAYEIMTLYEDALIQYDELEASFFQVLRDKALAWFGHFGGTDPEDDSGNILDFKRKNYRDLITKNIISVFDFRSYLFARQSRMLLKLQRVVEVATRAQMFITNFIPSIGENQEHLPVSFLESWVFSACMNVVNECETLYGQLVNTNHQLLVPYSSVKADLLLTARRQLDKIGIKCEHLPMTEPFSIYIDHPTRPIETDESEAEKSITNTKLLEALGSIDAFDKTYMGLSTRAIKSYDECFRSRAALNVHGDIAALKYIRGKYDEAVRIYESMIWNYGQHEWSAIENSLLIKCADSQCRLGKSDQYVESLLALLKNSKCLTDENASFYTNEVMSNVEKLDKEIKRSFFPIFSVAISNVIDDINTVKSTSIEICIDNHLPKKFRYDSISLRLVGNSPEQVWFSVSDQEMVPGKNTLLLTSETSTCGNYVVEACEMKLGRLIFCHNFLQPGQKKKVVRLNHDTHQLYACISQPNEICLGERQRFSVNIESRGSTAIGGILLLESQTEGMEISHVPKVKATLTNEEDEMEEFSLDMLGKGEIQLPDLKPNNTLKLYVLYEGPYTEFDYRVRNIKTSITYKDNGTQPRNFVSSDCVKVTIPLLVSESTIFRETCVFLKVELSCNGDLPVRILSSHAKPSTYYLIDSHPEMKECELTLFPKQTISFIYKLIKRESEEDLGKHQKYILTVNKHSSSLLDTHINSKIHFNIKFRSLRDEVESSLYLMMKERLEKQCLEQHLPYVFQKVKEAFLSSIDYASYGLTDVVHLDDFDAELCESFLLHRDLKTKVQLLDLVEEFFEENEAITMQMIKQKCPHPTEYSIAFPLEVSTSRILHTAELILSVKKNLLVSEACPCILRIKQSTHWMADPSSHYEFLYDIDVDYENWLLSGKRRVRFVSKPGEVMEFPLNLVPLKTGNLLLPLVRISAASPEVFTSTVYINSAQQILVKPKSKTATFFVEQQQRFLQPSYTVNPPVTVENGSRK
ncbi:Cullin family-domain-containing protein [Pilobolus umbonatus]|nr:Cullin family-domain-containing protein [Pilobolus umbonatus]